MSATTLAAEDRILDGLSSAQREAVLHGDGPLLIVAGAGTGKTTVLTRRIAHLISSKRCRPEEILALTFTEKAAREMSERVDQLIPYGYAETAISTFHAFGDAVLREFALELGQNPEFRVLTTPEQIIFLKERIFALPLERFRPLGDPARHLAHLVGFVSRAKDEDVSPEQYQAWAEAQSRAAVSEDERDAAARDLELARFYAAYERLLAESGVADFGDQIRRTLTLLRGRPSVLASLRARYRYVLVDEFQDTNQAQLQLLRLLAGELANITVVGDDDQAIYRWRGAASANLVAFGKLYPQAKQVVLADNHRSKQEILDAATRLISYNNPYRLEIIAGVDKKLRASRGRGDPVRHLHFDTVSAEADAVAALCADKLALGYRPRDIAILVRSNDDADPFLRALNVKRIPHRFSGSRGLYAREEVRQLVALLRVLASPSDSVSLFYLAAGAPYRLPAAELLRLNEHARRNSRPLLEVLRGLAESDDLKSVGGEARASAARLVADLDAAAEDVPKLRTGEVLYRHLQRTGALARLAREASPADEARARNLARFFETVKAYGQFAEHDRVPSFVLHLDLLREAGDDPAVAEAELDDDAVQVLTVHKAKGLEFEVVILVGCAEGKFPVQRRRDPLELPAALMEEPLAGGQAHVHEERRLFYVAMTRAKDELLLTSAADYGTAKVRKLSRFAVEALDLPSPRSLPAHASAHEALARNQPEPEAVLGPLAPLRDDATLRLSFNQVDDYETCPLKYRYVHLLRVPLLAHHRVIYGSALHRAVQQLFRARMESRPFSVDELVAAFRSAWVSEGFLSREHEERRLAAGEQALRRFHENEAKDPLVPTGVEQEFVFYIGRNKLVGRYDLVVEKDGSASILDFKSGEVDDAKRAQQRAQESLQLDVYALAFLKTRGRLPEWVELRFLETGLAAGKRPTLDEARRTEARILAAAASIRRREFPARPSFLACSFCAFRDICPHTARGPEADA